MIGNYRRGTLNYSRALLAAALFAVSHVSAMAQDASSDHDKLPGISKLNWGYETDYNPKYVWRGLAFSDGAVAQSSAWITAKGTTLSVWTNTNLEQVDRPQTDEVDYSASWEGSWHKATLEPNLQVYTYPDQPDSP